MRQKAEIWQTCRGTTQDREKNVKPGEFFPRWCEMGAGKCNVLQYTGTDGKTRNIVKKKKLCNYETSASSK
jgi:hypothetical protein